MVMLYLINVSRVGVSCLLWFYRFSSLRNRMSKRFNVGPITEPTGDRSAEVDSLAVDSLDRNRQRAGN